MSFTTNRPSFGQPAPSATPEIDSAADAVAADRSLTRLGRSAFLGTALTVALVAGSAHARCVEVAWDPVPEWLSSGAWFDGDGLAAADARRGILAVYAPDASARDGNRVTYRQVGKLSPEGFHAIEVRAASGGLWAMDPGGRALEIDAGGEVVRQIALVGTPDQNAVRNDASDSRDTLRSVLSWGPDERGGLVVFGDIDRGGAGGAEEGARNYGSGFVSVAVDGDLGRGGYATPARFTVNQERGFRADGLDYYYRLGYPYVASNGQHTYAVAMDRLPGILRLTGDHADYVATEEGRLARSGALDEGLEPSTDFVRFFGQTRDAALPVAIFADARHVYVIQKRSHFLEPEDRWQLKRFPIREDGSLDEAAYGRVRLPIADATEHLTVVAGARWLVVEKGAVTGPLEAEVVRSWQFDAADLQYLDWRRDEPAMLCASAP